MHTNSAHRFNPKAIVWCLLGSFISCALPVAAQAPLSLGSDTITVGTSIRVLRPGPDLQSILDGITDAGPSNPYLLHLGPGVYELTERLQMKPYVDVSGSGENVTILRGSLASGFNTAGVVSMALHSTLSHLAVENSAETGSSIFAINAFKLDAQGDASTARLLHVTAESAGDASSSSRGVHMEESSIRIEHVTAKVTGTTTNYGIRAYDSSPTVTNVSATVHSGATRNWAFYISESGAQPVLTETTASATGMESYGYNVTSSATPTILRSVIRGETAAINADSSTVVVVAQSLLEGMVTGGGTFQCVANSDVDGVEREAACEQAMLDAPE